MAPKEWLVDSGATHHMTTTNEDLSARRTGRTISYVRLGDGKRIICTDEGTIRICDETAVGREDGTVVLENALVVPDLEKNLISVYGLCQSGYDVFFRSKSMTCEITRGPVKIVAVLEGKLWTIRGSGVIDIGVTEGTADVAAASLFTRGPESLEIWHRRFNHANVASLRRMAAEKKVYGLELTGASNELRTCVGCAYGKHSRDPFPTLSTKKTVKKLELVHSDLCGPIEVLSLQSQKKYILTFIDDYTRRTWIYLLARKDETFAAFQTFKAKVEKQSECKIKTLHTDGGGEYIGGEFREFLRREGIDHQLTFPDSPQQNGVAERYNRTLMEGVRAMLHGAGVSRGFWGEAALCFNYTRNRMLAKGVAGDVTPLEAWTGRVPSVVHLRAFGST